VNEIFPIFDSGYIGSSTYGVFISNSSPGTVTIANSDIDGGKLTSASNYGIYVPAGDVNIVNNVEINGGGVAGPGSSTALYFLGGASGSVDNNVISGGIGNNSTGVVLNSTGSVSLTNNAIDGGGKYDVVGSSSIGLSVGGGISGTVSDNLITGGVAESSTGVRIQNASGSVLLANNNLWGGDGNVGVAVDDAGFSTTLEHNEIHGASAASSATAIKSTGAGTRIYLRNTITGGVSGGPNTGILLDSATNGVLVRSNLMTGCQGYTGFFLQGPCIAIDNNGTGNKFYNNTVNAGSGAQFFVDVGYTSFKSIGYREGVSATGVDLRNNLFFTSVGGVLGAAGGRCLDVNDSANLFAITRNDFFSCGGSVYYDRTSALEYTVNDTLPGFGVTLASAGNTQDVDPAFVSIGANPGQLGTVDVDWHLTPGSPATVRGGGVSISCSYTDPDDVQYNSDNTAGAVGGWPMGAYTSPTQDPPSGC
jgi:hypothetical protein